MPKKNHHLRDMTRIALIIAATAATASGQWAHREGDPPPADKGELVEEFTKAQWDSSNFAPAQEVARFRSLRYGMFIHFGVTCKAHRDLSWGSIPGSDQRSPDQGHAMTNGSVPTSEWTTWAKDMKLEKFDAREWVDIARKCGYQYIVVTVKHHEGFHMWDTAFSGFKITNTPFGRDYLKELTDACHAAKMPIGFYYSQRDFYHPDYQPVDHAKTETVGQYWWKLKPGETSPLGPRHKKYIDYQFNVCRELCTKYGRIDFWWWDAVSLNGMFTAEMWDAEKLCRMVRELQPRIVMNNRCSVPGDYDTPEQRLGSWEDWRAWETCMPIQADGGWAYSGAPVKPLAERIHILVNNICGDGNTLMSWGPHWDGAFDAAQIKAQLEMGAWVQKNAKAIYQTRGGPWKPATGGGSTRRDNAAWLHITKWPGETLRLPAILGRTVKSARLPGGESVSFEQSAETLSVTLPRAQQDPVDTIIELVFDKPVAGLTAVDGAAKQ